MRLHGSGHAAQDPHIFSVTFNLQLFKRSLPMIFPWISWHFLVDFIFILIYSFIAQQHVVSFWP